MVVRYLVSMEVKSARTRMRTSPLLLPQAIKKRQKKKEERSAENAGFGYTRVLASGTGLSDTHLGNTYLLTLDTR